MRLLWNCLTGGKREMQVEDVKPGDSGTFYLLNLDRVELELDNGMKIRGEEALRWWQRRQR